MASTCNADYYQMQIYSRVTQLTFVASHWLCHWTRLKFGGVATLADSKARVVSGESGQTSLTPAQRP